MKYSNEYLNQLSSDEKVENIFKQFNKNLDILKSYKLNIHSMFFYELIHDQKHWLWDIYV